MKANAVVTTLAATLALVTAADVAAQRDDSRRDAPAAVRVEVPSGGLVLNFADIDRNKDGSISVEEWNAFLAALPARSASSDSGRAGGGAAAGASAAEKQPQQKR